MDRNAPTFTMRRTWPDEPGRADDFVFRVDGRDAGRCYLTTAPGNYSVWLWTVYGKARGGMVPTLGEAQAAFKQACEEHHGRQPNV